MYSKVFRNIFNFTSANKSHQVHKYTYAKDIPGTIQRNHMNLFTAINSAIDISLETDPT